MQIDWNIHCPLDRNILEKMQEAANLCLKCEDVPESCSVSVCLCDDDYIAGINREYRDTDRSTDVLSFPSVSYPEGHTAGSCAKLLRLEYDDESQSCFLGDIFISVPHVFAQAEEYGHSPMREAVYLLVHGICHLMGYDHIEPEDKEKMRAME